MVEPMIVELRQQLRNGVLMRLVLVLLITVVVKLVSGVVFLIRRWLWQLELAVPQLLDLVDFASAEVAPFNNLFLFVEVEVFFCVGVFFVELLLRDVAKLERDLCDLAHVHALSFVAGRVGEPLLAFELDLYKVFEDFEVLLVELGFKRVEDVDALLVARA